MAGTRLDRGLAAMLVGPLGDAYAPLVTYGIPEWFVPDMLATPTGQALAALVEAAEAWSLSLAGGTVVDLQNAVDAWLAATEETTDA